MRRGPHLMRVVYIPDPLRFISCMYSAANGMDGWMDERLTNARPVGVYWFYDDDLYRCIRNSDPS